MSYTQLFNTPQNNANIYRPNNDVMLKSYMNNPKRDLVNLLLYDINNNCTYCNDMYIHINFIFNNFMINDTNNIIFEYLFDETCNVCDNKCDYNSTNFNENFHLIIYDYCDFYDLIENSHELISIVSNQNTYQVQKNIFEKCIDEMKNIYNSQIYVFAASYNILRMSDGLGGLKFSY